MPFRDRIDAGGRLGRRLESLRGEDVIVLGLPRGGVPVAAAVAERLGAPLDVIVVRKLGVPFQPELGMGAIGEDGVKVINADVVRSAGVGAAELAAVEDRERAKLRQRSEHLRESRPRLDLTGRTALIIDDGIATGSTARAACRVAREHGAARIVLAVPVAPVDAAARLRDVADEFIALETPSPFYGVGQFYVDFSPTADDEVVDLLARGRRYGAELDIVCGTVTLSGYLEMPERPKGLVLFAHGSGSSRHSARNRHVAFMLNRAGMATLLFDLLTPLESDDLGNVFDVALLGDRLVEVLEWVRLDSSMADLPVGIFGASTGAAAALWAAAEPDVALAAVVSRGGRPDLANDCLELVRAPTRLIVGGRDDLVERLNRRARRRLRCENDLVVVPGATHLFEESGALDCVAQLAVEWFDRHFSSWSAHTD